MNNQVPKYYTQARASLLLACQKRSRPHLRRNRGWGTKNAPATRRSVLHPEELQRICEIAGRHIRDNQLYEDPGHPASSMSGRNLSLPRRISGTCGFRSGRKTAAPIIPNKASA